MKKLSILLSLVMVLGMAVSASAADLSATGYVKYGFEKVGEADFFGTFYAMPDWRVQLKAQVNENLSATLRFDDKEDGVQVQRAFFNYNFGPASTNVGKLGFGGSGEFGDLSATVVGASVKVPFELGSVGAAVGPVKEAKNPNLYFTGDVAPIEGLKLYGDVRMKYDADADEYKNDYAVEAVYNVAGFTVYGEYGLNNAQDEVTKVWTEEDLIKVGASTTVSAFDLTLEYDIENESADFNVETNYNGLLVGGNFVTAPKDKDDNTIKGYVKVSF